MSTATGAAHTAPSRSPPAPSTPTASQPPGAAAPRAAAPARGPAGQRCPTSPRSGPPAAGPAPSEGVGPTPAPASARRHRPPFLRALSHPQTHDPPAPAPAPATPLGAAHATATPPLACGSWRGTGGHSHAHAAGDDLSVTVHSVASSCLDNFLWGDEPAAPVDAPAPPAECLRDGIATDERGTAVRGCRLAGARASLPPRRRLLRYHVGQGPAALLALAILGLLVSEWQGLGGLWSCALYALLSAAALLWQVMASLGRERHALRLIGDAAADARGADEGAERGFADVRVRYVQRRIRDRRVEALMLEEEEQRRISNPLLVLAPQLQVAGPLPECR